MDIVQPDIDRYLAELSVGGPVTEEMQRRARESGFPIVGPQVGRMLFLLVRLMEARRILELGSGFGYSACWFGKALPAEGELILCDYQKENLAQARRYLSRHGVDCRLEFKAGDAIESMATLEGPFDIIFNDLDKHSYPLAFEKSIPLLRQGGLLITDNALWDGRVLEDRSDKDTRGVLEYTRRAFSDPRVFSTILPIRDGVAVSLKM